MRSALVLLALACTATPARANDLHPAVTLRDASGAPVLETGAPVDLRQSCGGDCHDVGYIEESSYHAAIPDDPPPEAPSRWDRGVELRARFAPLVHGQPGAADPASERWVGGRGDRPMNCMVCHAATPDRDARRAALRSGHPEWEATAILAETGLVERAGAGWTYRAEAFQADGTVTAETLGLVAPQSEACLSCHGNLVRPDADGVVGVPPVTELSRALATGLAFSPESIHRSALNVAGKEELQTPFDIHAERLLDCTSCHHSINNPAYRAEDRESRPSHLRFDARRESISAFVKRPSHNLVTGHASQTLLGPGVTGTMRRCEDCHAAPGAHDWLPYAERHFQSLACETCHIPRVWTPTLESVDWTVLTSSTSPRVRYRGLPSAPDDVQTLQDGFRPVWLERSESDEPARMFPHNLVTQFFWVGGEPERPVPLEVLAEVQFDARGEPRLDGRDDAGRPTPEALRQIAAALEAEGFADARIVGEVQPFGLHHDVVGKGRATKDCQQCHHEASELLDPVVLADAAPPGADVEWRGRVPPAGRIEQTDSGALRFVPELRSSGIYVLGLHRTAWIDGLGLAMLGLILLGAVGHGVARIMLGKGRS